MSYHCRIEQFMLSLPEEEGFVVEAPIDLLYLTGLNLSKGRLWVSRTEVCLFVDGRYLAVAQAKAPCPVHLWEEKKMRAVFGSGKRIAFDSAFTSYDGFLALQKGFAEVEWVPIANGLKGRRLYKEAVEVAALKRAATLTWKGYHHILTQLREGITEGELALEFEFFCRKQGASGLSFEPIIAFGENSAYPHHRAGATKLQKNQLILIDVGAVVDQYRGDMTRVHAFGTIDPKLKQLEKWVTGAQKKAVAHVRPGVRIGELDQIVREEFRKEGVESLFTHSLGHGIGLETHEYPRIKFDGEDRDLVLQAGMVFTIEPGLYQPGLGGIRYEDTVLVTEEGCENFYLSVSL